MVKRLFCLLLSLALLSALIPTQAAGAVTEVMQVVRCSEWVSLRAEPSTSSQRLAKVYLGELVTHCTEAFDGFIFCEYNGKSGYILSQYLGSTDYTEEDGILPNQMVVNVVEYATMHSGPSSSSNRVARVPVGAVVTSCVKDTGNYVYCEYNGNSGYISSTYLRKANYNVTRQDASVVKKYEGLYPAIYGTMEVVNCNEWVSLREKASASSARLARVPLGTEVTDCLQVSDTFIYCCYMGVWGYIQTAYLSGSGDTYEKEGETSAFDALGDHPEYDQFNAVGTLVEEFWSDPQHTYRVVIRKDDVNMSETICAAVYDSEIQYLCRMSMTDYNISEISSLSVFGGGTEENRVLLWYSGANLTAYDIGPKMYDNILWSLDLPNVGGGVSHAVDSDGTIYMIGYYQNLLTCISPDGKLLWQVSNENEDVYWPVRIEIEDKQVSVVYEESGDHDGTEAVISFSKADGHIMSGAAPAPAAASVAEAAVRLNWSKETDTPYYLFTASTESEAAGVLLTPLAVLRDFEFLAISYQDLGDGSAHFDTEILFTQQELTPETSLLVLTAFNGDIPNNGFAYVDGTGARHVFALDISGENGELISYEINR